MSVKWTAIDIDVNDIDHSRLEAKMNEPGLPLIVCRSKSGGAELGCLEMKKVAINMADLKDQAFG